ncbi:AMP-binding protein [Achromobacter sp. RTa]|uniref:AMP-binding protein n=1 Tax=Achromobacter sp. RTa TaxID=1532557 RepID=UPI00050FA1E2|nr:AMP-binding protein [Achromobacter sp. RTa]KGD95270.1 AMP-binding protein [Achromobacter sp. RTa]
MHLSRLFQRSVRMFGARPALAQGKAPALTYLELDRRVRALAHWLQAGLGLRPGDRVALAMKNSVEYAEAMLAIWHARLCAVPINCKLHPTETAYVLEDSQARLCLVQGDGADELRQASARGRDLQIVDVGSQQWLSAGVGTPAPDATVIDGGHELAWLFYTSGTTGKPKGVKLSHANLVAMAMNFQCDMLAIDETDVLIHAAPMSHGSGLYGVPYWMRGGLQLVPDSGGFDESELFSLLGHYERASFFAAPTMITRMLQHAGNADPALPGLRCIFAGGAPFYVEDIKAAVRCFGPRIAQMYGQGETPMTISALPAHVIGQAVALRDDDLLASVGYAQTSVDIDIVDEQGRPLPPGEVGEVTVRSPTVMQGYWRNDEASAQALAGGALQTGDVGLIDDRGLLHLKDRSKDVIISGGTNIYPREVEEVLLRHPRVREVSVIGAPDPEWGESVVAVVVALEPVGADELNALCLACMARFKRPKRYVFMDSLPKNATGKVLKGELKKRCAVEPMPS